MIAIIGTGAIGSLLAEGFAYRAGEDVLCVVNTREHADRIAKKGIEIEHLVEGFEIIDNSKFTGLNAVTDTDNLKAADIVFVAVKAPITADAVKKHRNLFGRDTIAVSLQNGYWNDKALESVVSRENIIMGTTALAAYVDERGTVFHAGNGMTLVGAAVSESKAGNAAARRIVALLTKCGFDARFTEDAEDAVLKKLFINIGINALCAVHRITNGELLKDVDLMEESRSLVREAVNIVNAATGRKYAAHAIEADVVRTLTATSANRCSMLQDVERGRVTEIQSINGAVVRLAESMDMNAPYNKAVVAAVEAI